MKDSIKKAHKQLDARPKATPHRCLSTGCTLLNLACSGKADGGLQTGGYYLLVGDSSSGKTVFTMTLFAEACHSKAFDGYQLIHNNVEFGMLMDVERYFGKKAAGRIQTVSTPTTEGFYAHLEAACNKGPCVYVLDSMDSLDTEDDRAKTKQKRNAKDGEKVSGSYGTSKAKLNSSGLRSAIIALQASQSILVIISQTRDNIGPGAMFDPKTRGGGKAMRFYATVEMWTSVGEKIRVVRSNGKREKVGIVSKVQVKKNRLQGREPVVQVCILDRHGVDDVGTSVDFLVDELRWPIDRKVIDATDFGIKAKRERLIEQIQAGDLERDLKLLVAEVWDAIEAECKVTRKRRYE